MEPSPEQRTSLIAFDVYNPPLGRLPRCPRPGCDGALVCERAGENVNVSCTAFDCGFHELHNRAGLVTPTASLSDLAQWRKAKAKGRGADPPMLAGSPPRPPRTWDHPDRFAKPPKPEEPEEQQEQLQEQEEEAEPVKPVAPPEPEPNAITLAPPPPPPDEEPPMPAPESKRQCELQGCQGDHMMRGLCGAHYQRWVACGKPDMAQWRAAGGPPKSEWKNLVASKGGTDAPATLAAPAPRTRRAKSVAERANPEQVAKQIQSLPSPTHPLAATSAFLRDRAGELVSLADRIDQVAGWPTGLLNPNPKPDTPHPRPPD